MPDIESHFLVLLNHVLTHERKHFFESVEVSTESELQASITNPSIQHVWKSANILCRAFEAGLITIKGN